MKKGLICGIISDSHEDEDEALPHVIAELVRRGVDMIIHCGDIEPKHLDPKLFHNIPVVCALTKNQVVDGVVKEQFQITPAGWMFTKPGNRVFNLTEYQRAYGGHATSFDFLVGSEAKLDQKLQSIRDANDCVRWFFSGHTHHQIFKQGHVINFVNPGAIADSFDGYEFAVINTGNGEIVFGRIMKTKPTRSPISIGVISDSFDINDIDPSFLYKLSEEFRKRDVRYIIHCGGISLTDIGRPELENFQVYFNLRTDQKVGQKNYPNWHLISAKNPVVDIEGNKFCIQYELGGDLIDKSEYDMHKLCLGLKKRFPEIRTVLTGFTNDAFYEEGEEVRIINPGDVLKDRNFAVVCLPRTEITFGHVPLDPLGPPPNIDNTVKSV